MKQLPLVVALVLLAGAIAMFAMRLESSSNDQLDSPSETVVTTDAATVVPPAEPVGEDTVEFANTDWTDFIKESQDTWSQYGTPEVTPTAEALRDIILMNQSFAFDRLPIGYWTYSSLHNEEAASHVTRDEVADWAAIGATVMKGPEWNPDDPEQFAHMMNLLDWCEEFEIKLMIRDHRTSVPTESRPSRIAETRDDVAQHPAFFSYHVCDEPHHIDSDDYGVARHCAYIKENVSNGRPYVNGGPFHPGVEDFLGVETYSEYIDVFAEKGNVDFLAFDIYDQMFAGRGGWNAFFANLRLYREGSWRHGIPYWITPVSSGHYAYEPPTFDDYRWQLNSSVASGAQGILWFFYYMRDPHLNYIDPPVNEFWEKTQTWDDMRKVHQEFHRRFGDLFMNLASTRVTFIPNAYGGGTDYTGNELTEMIIAPNSMEAPAILGEFIDLEGQRYIMLVNLHRTESIWWCIKFPGEDVEIYNYGWDGKEHHGASAARSRYEKGPSGAIGVGYWLRPGQAIVQRVDSTAIRNSELTLAMRELNGLAAQPPKDLEMAQEALTAAQERVDALTDEDSQGHRDWSLKRLDEATARLAEMEAKYAETADAE